MSPYIITLFGRKTDVKEIQAEVILLKMVYLRVDTHKKEDIFTQKKNL